MFAEQAYKNFFASVKGTRAGSAVGKPKFKSKKSHDFSYRECMNIALIWNERKIKVQKLGLVKFRHSGNKKGKLDFFLRGEVELKSITIRKNPANEYYAVLLFERGAEAQNELQTFFTDFANELQRGGVIIGPLNLVGYNVIAA